MQTHFGKDGAHFRQIVLDPWAVCLLLLHLFLGNRAVVQTDPQITAILTILLSLVTGVLGAVYVRRWSRLTEQQLITARGQTAVRSLKLL